jgi:hypothetical protein
MHVPWSCEPPPAANLMDRVVVRACIPIHAQYKIASVMPEFSLHAILYCGCS